MTNVNCLAGIKCPHCGQEERFYIQSTVMAVVTDDGAEAKDGNFEWGESSGIHCPDCYADGTVKEFTAKARAA